MSSKNATFPKLLSVSADAKTVKGEKQGYLTGVMYLAPYKLSGYQVCPRATKGCAEACLGWQAGRVAIVQAGTDTNTIRDSRVAKTRAYFEQRDAFMAQLVKEIAALVRKARRQNMVPVVRLNGSSDIPFERIAVGDAPNIMALFPDVQFYDYTAVAKRAFDAARHAWTMPANYHLTFSRKETVRNHFEATAVLQAGGTVAAVFDKVPEAWESFKVIDGDDSDLRFLDPAGVIVGLKAKGAARKDTSGFVIRTAAA